MQRLISTLAVLIVYGLMNASICEAQYTTGAARGTPAGVPAMTPYTYTVRGGLATDSFRVRIQKISSYGMGGITFDPIFGTTVLVLAPKSVTAPGGNQQYDRHELIDSSLVTASGQYYVEFEKQFPTSSIVGTVIVIP